MITLRNITRTGLIGIALAVSVAAQQESPAPTPPSVPPTKVKVSAPVTEVRMPLGETERSIAVTKDATVSLCVSEGELRVNGWDRDEVRALVVGGDQRFVVAQTAGTKIVSVAIVGAVRNQNSKVTAEPCLKAESIELDVPRGAYVAVRGRTGSARIESVAKVRVETVSGEITLRDIGSGVSATTYEGSVFAERIRGTIALVGDTVVAIDAAPVGAGDSFMARAGSGYVTLQSVDHRMISVNTISGGIVYRGKVRTDGNYQFSSQSGRVAVTVPEDISCKLVIWKGVGSFSSSLPLKNEVVSGPSTTAQIGDGEPGCTLTLKTTSGQLKVVVGAK